MKNKRAILTGLITAGLLVACSAITTNEKQPAIRVFPTATYHFLFQGAPAAGNTDSPVSLPGAPTVNSIFLQQPSATVSPSPSATSTPTPKPPSATPTPRPRIYTVTVYEESLNPNWEVLPNTGVKFDLNSSSHVYGGQSAISFVPKVKNNAQHGSLFFTVTDQSSEAYPRDQVTTLSFWLYSGDEPLLLDQMAVTIVGSNSQPYWLANDDSVSSSGQDSPFSETRLYFLGFNRDIPAKTWVPVEVNLDKLIYDVDYKYVTGFYLKMEAGFSRSLWVDDIRLEMLGEPAAISTPEITPSAQSN